MVEVIKGRTVEGGPTMWTTGANLTKFTVGRTEDANDVVFPAQTTISGVEWCGMCSVAWRSVVVCRVVAYCGVAWRGVAWRGVE